MNMPPLLMVMVGMFTLWPAFILPVIAGPVILRLFRDDPVRGLAGWFTLKPLIATPIWIFIVSLSDGPKGWVLPFSLLPGIGLTLYLVYKFRHLLDAERKIFTVLLAGDALRWLNSFVFLLASGGTFPGWNEEIPYRIGVILPNAYAVMAFVILWLRRKRGEAPSVVHNV